MCKTKFMSVFFAAIVLAASACDMTRIPSTNAGENPGSEIVELSEQERDQLEQSGHFLKLTYMPLNTHVNDVLSVQIANSDHVIAGPAADNPVRIFRDNKSATAMLYFLLAYEDGSEFTETGPFYAAFAVHVDALVSYIVVLSDKCIVPFTDGRGELDSRTLLSPDSSNPAVILSEYERDQLEQSGHFLKLTHIPVNTHVNDVSSVQIANSHFAVAGLAADNPVRIFLDSQSGAAMLYLLLAYEDGSEFTETGPFYAAFAVHVDALVSYIVVLSDKCIVPFTGGRGEFDTRNLPYLSGAFPSDDGTDYDSVSCLIIRGLPGPNPIR